MLGKKSSLMVLKAELRKNGVCIVFAELYVFICEILVFRICKVKEESYLFLYSDNQLWNNRILPRSHDEMGDRVVV